MKLKLQDLGLDLRLVSLDFGLDSGLACLDSGLDSGLEGKDLRLMYDLQNNDLVPPLLSNTATRGCHSQSTLSHTNLHLSFATVRLFPSPLQPFLNLPPLVLWSSLV